MESKQEIALCEKIKGDMMQALFLRFDSLNNEYCKLHKGVFFFSFKRKNLNYESLTKQAHELSETMATFRELFIQTCPVELKIKEQINNVLSAETLAISALTNYLSEKWVPGPNYSEMEERERRRSEIRPSIPTEYRPATARETTDP